MMKALLALALCTGWLLNSSEVANAQIYPKKEPIKIVVPFPPGGPTDGMARIISERLGEVLGQVIVIENRGGAGGGVGGKFVAAANPDGYTILMSPGGALTTGPTVNPDIGYDPAKVFAPVCELIETPLIISVNPDLPVKSLAEVVAYAKANPGKLRWGSQGFGTAPHLLAEMFKLEAGINILHVPYRGTGPAAQCHSGRRGEDHRRPQHHQPAIHPGWQAAPDRDRRQRTRSEIAGRADRGRGGLSQTAVAFLARGGGAGCNAAPTLSPSSTMRSAKRSPCRKPARGSTALGAEIKIGSPAGSRQDAHRGTGAVDPRGAGGAHQDGMKLCGSQSSRACKPSPYSHIEINRHVPSRYTRRGRSSAPKCGRGSRPICRLRCGGARPGRRPRS